MTTTKKIDGSTMAKQFLHDHPEIWMARVPNDIAQNVMAALAS